MDVLRAHSLHPGAHMPIVFRILEKAPASIRILSLNGAQIRLIQKAKNTNTVAWDLRDANGTAVPAGVYVYKVELPEKAVATGTCIIAGN